MKKAFIFITLITMLLSASCSKPQNDQSDPKTNEMTQTDIAPDIVQSDPVPDTENNIIQADPKPNTENNVTIQQHKIDRSLLEPITDLSQYDFTGTDCSILKPVSKDSFKNDIVFEWNGQKITIEAPKYTGIKIDNVYSFKANYEFNSEGFESVSTSCGYFTIDRDGNVYNYRNFKTVEHDSCIYKEFFDGYKLYGGRQIGNYTIIEQVGESGNYKQRILSLNKEPLSKYFDYISYFYNGLALVSENNKIGLIDENGNTLLEPSISYDYIEYPMPDPEQNFKGFALGNMVNDAIILPIGGEIAVINIKREPLDWISPYVEFVSTLDNVDGYTVKDLDGNGSYELIVKRALELTVYDYNGKFSEIGTHDFATGTLRLLESKKYPGIIVFTVGSGAYRYRYLTLKDNKISIDNIWNDYYAYDGINTDIYPNKVEEFTTDKQLISESKSAYQKNNDIYFLPA